MEGVGGFGGCGCLPAARPSWKSPLPWDELHSRIQHAVHRRRQQVHLSFLGHTLPVQLPQTTILRGEHGRCEEFSCLALVARQAGPGGPLASVHLATWTPSSSVSTTRPEPMEVRIRKPVLSASESTLPQTRTISRAFVVREHPAATASSCAGHPRTSSDNLPWESGPLGSAASAWCEMRDVTSEDPPNRELRVLGAPRLGKVAVDGGGHGFSPLSQQKPPSSRILRRQFELAQGLCEPGLLGGGWRVEACRRFDTRPDMDYGVDSGPGESGGPLVPSQPSRRAGPWASSLPDRACRDDGKRKR